MKTPEQRRRDFREWSDDNLLIPDAQVQEIATYWLEEFSAYKEELRAGVEKLTRKRMFKYGTTELEDEWYVDKDAVLTLLSTPVPEGEVNNK